MARITVVSPTPDAERRIADLWPEPESVDRCWGTDPGTGAGGCDESPQNMADRLADGGADVVVIGPAVEPADAILLARALDRDHPALSVVLVVLPTPALLEEALRAGVRDVVDPSASDAELEAALARVAGVALRRRELLGAAEEQGTEARLIVVLAPKGGSGKTTMATNLAVTLAQEHPGEVAIVDFDLQFGDVASALSITPEQTITDSQRPGVHLDATTLKAFLAPHPSGLFVLCAPEEPAQAEELLIDHLHRVLKLLASEFRYVVVDTSAGIDDAGLAAMDLATDIVLLTTTDVPSVRATRKQAEALLALQMGDRRWHVVLNRADARVGLDRQDIERTLGLTIDAEVPSSRSVPLSVNEGRPVVEREPKSRVAQALIQLAERFDTPITTTTASADTRRRGWRRDR